MRALPMCRTPARALLSFLIACAAVTASLPAQPYIDRLRQVEATTRPDSVLEQWTRPPSPQQNFEYGAWSAPALIVFDDVDNDSATPDGIRSTLVLDQRLWGRWDLESGVSFYGRARYLDLRHDLGPGGVAPAVFEEGWTLDLGYVNVPRDAWSFRLGRQYIFLSRGVVFGGKLDALKVDFRQGQWSGWAFGGRTPDYTTDGDPFIGRSERDVYGAGLTYATPTDHRLFAYGVLQDDQNRTVLPGQGLRYDSDYFAAGAEGPLFGDLDYYVEGILQGGRSFDLGSATARSDVDADALLAEVTWRPGRAHHPTVSLGYFRGSGDPDRGSVVTSAAGNAAGTLDTAFAGLGSFGGGLALSPRLSNLQVYRLGATYQLLESRVDDESLALLAAVYLYEKDDPRGPISSAAARRVSEDVGAAFDLGLAWKPAHDLTLGLNVGRFYPGTAFAPANRHESTVLFTSLTYSY